MAPYLTVSSAQGRDWRAGGVRPPATLAVVEEDVVASELVTQCLNQRIGRVDAPVVAELQQGAGVAGTVVDGERAVAAVAAAQLGQSNAVIADGRLFAAVTAVVVGGTALTGGEGGVLNTLVGVLIVTVLSNGMVLLGVSPYVQQTIQGLLIIAAVALSLDRLRLKIVK